MCQLILQQDTGTEHVMNPDLFKHVTLLSFESIFGILYKTV